MKSILYFPQSKCSFVFVKCQITPVCNESSKTYIITTSSTQSGSSYHVNIELIEAAERRLCDGPKGENKANSGEGALAPGQRAHVTQVSLFSLTRLHLGRREPQFQLVLVAALLDF